VPLLLGRVTTERMMVFPLELQLVVQQRLLSAISIRFHHVCTLGSCHEGSSLSKYQTTSATFLNIHTKNKKKHLKTLNNLKEKTTCCNTWGGGFKVCKQQSIMAIKAFWSQSQSNRYLHTYVYLHVNKQILLFFFLELR